MILNYAPDICCYHGGGCLDGHTAAWIVRQKFPQTEFVAAQYGDDPPDVTDKVVLIVDFSYSEEVLREMARTAKEIIVCDHHKSAQEHLERLGEEKVIKVFFDLERSGAAITYDLIWGRLGRYNTIVEVVQDRDLWRFQYAHTKPLTAVLFSHPMNFGMWDILGRQMEDPGRRAQLILEGNAILRMRDRDIEAAVKASAKRISFCGYDVPIANVPYLWASDAGNILAAGEPFSITYFDRPDGARQFSLRRREGSVKVNELAALFGGGGHEPAAGFHILDWDETESVLEAILTPPAEEIIPLAPPKAKVKVETDAET